MKEDALGPQCERCHGMLVASRDIEIHGNVWMKCIGCGNCFDRRVLGMRDGTVRIKPDPKNEVYRSVVGLKLRLNP